MKIITRLISRTKYSKFLLKVEVMFESQMHDIRYCIESTSIFMPLATSTDANDKMKRIKKVF